MDNMNKKTALWVAGLLTAWSMLAAPSTAWAQPGKKPKNIIMIVGDGMGPGYITGYRNIMDNPDTRMVETTIFDRLLVGASTTYAIGTQTDHYDLTYVTDSAASATALSTGHKTYNQAVAVDAEDKHLQTLMQFAKAQGLITGLVVTSQINHATPAAYVAHNTYRYNYNDIANQFFDNRVNGKFVADLMFGGGQKYFIREDRNIVEQFKQAGYQYRDQFGQLAEFNRLPALGLFAESGMGFAIDNTPKNRLRSMVQKAISLLDGQKAGYFLLVESSLIDWCGHSNDIACAMHEMDGLAKTVEWLTGYVDKHPDTLMVMTADHDTGGLSIGSNGKYRWKPDAVRTIKRSIDHIGKRLLDNEPVRTVWAETVGIELSDNQASEINKVQKQSIHAIEQTRDPLLSQSMTEAQIKQIHANGKLDVERAVAKVIADNTLTGWTSSNHTGVDVPVFAHGHSKQKFAGYQENTDIADKLFELLK